MGWDRVRIFETVDEQTGEPNATLLSADKSSAEVVYGRDFSNLLNILGYRATRVVDRQEVPKRVEYALRSQPKDRDVLWQFATMQVIDFPEAARADWYGAPTATHAVEVQPPLDEQNMGIITRYLDQYCEPSDAGPLFLDHRGSHIGCNFRPGTGGAICPPGSA